ncbi:hypothetical protein TRFO_23598 [Tritrichomonas foetus]|uniref:Ubiquitin-like domain-containing protein n=1 Tax=Tritrichomonas foetus TaxID=1144522 RepID=A0A1J4KAS4_9EUKA|nr:hypothetical protein TRFO_23598 [Tritrichomonas foetus]|eukprot:OHT08058.1 hypothetical protein TRFO_23598 [Tritrichomonas foetus]
MMGKEIEIHVQWKESLKIPVKVSSLITPIELAEISKPDNIYYTSPKFLYNGRLLNHSLSLEAQRISNNSTVIIYERGFFPTMFDDIDVPYIQTTTFVEKIYSIILEVHRIKDQRYSSVESHRRSYGFQLIKNIDDYEEQIEQEPTVIPKKAENVSTAPLPVSNSEAENDLEEEEEGNEEESGIFFENFEEAGKFFTKHPWSEWSW